MIDPRQVADALVAAERERKPIVPFTDMYPFLDAGREYHAQRLFVADHLNGGDQGIGAKLGMTKPGQAGHARASTSRLADGSPPGWSFLTVSRWHSDS